MKESVISAHLNEILPSKQISPLTPASGGLHLLICLVTTLQISTSIVGILSLSLHFRHYSVISLFDKVSFFALCVTDDLTKLDGQKIHLVCSNITNSLITICFFSFDRLMMMTHFTKLTLGSSLLTTKLLPRVNPVWTDACKHVPVYPAGTPHVGP